VTVPYPTGTGYPPAPPAPTSEAPYPAPSSVAPYPAPSSVAPYPAPSSVAPYPVPSSVAPYPVPSGTGYPAPPAGTASSTGGYVKPSAPPEFTGAASHAQIGGFVAGVGAFAAFFL
jgi:hypothetical protein